MGTTQRLAEFLVNTRYEDIPENVIHIAKRTALDSIGVSLAGSHETCGNAISNFVKKLSSVPEAGVVGKDFRTYAPYAGLANGTMANALDYDDCGIKIGHPSVLVFPTVITLGDELRASGKEILAAYILALEVQCKIALSCNLSNSVRVITHYAFLGGIGAAAAAARLLKLDVNHTRIAFGIVTNLASGVQSASQGTWLSPTKAGNVSYNGITAVLMAQEGFPANLDIIESDGGLCDTFVGRGNYSLERMTADLGSPFFMESPGITIKKYPSCFITHRALDAVLNLVGRHDIDYEDVASVDVGITRRALNVLAFSEPGSGYQGKFSMQYCVASALLDKKVNLGTFADEKVRTTRVKEAMGKVRLSYPDLPIFSGLSQVDPDKAPPVGNPITIYLKDGRSCADRVDVLKGSPEVPLTDQELTAKYRDCARQVLSPHAIEESVGLILNLDKVKDFREIMDILCNLKNPEKVA